MSRSAREHSPTARRIYLRYPKDSDGKALCRWCEGPVPKGRKYWCGQECVEEYRLASDQSHVRWLLEKRDHGVCALCRWDAITARREVSRLNWMERREVARRLGVPEWRESWWDADHILPVVRGGARLGLSNFRTLCIPCHRKETARLAGERAQERKRARPTAQEGKEK